MSEASIRTGDAGEFQVAGPLSFDSVPGLWRDGLALMGGLSGPLTLDLEGVTRTDSAGLALLIEWMREARRRGVEMRLRHIPAQLRAIAQTSRLAHLLQENDTPQ